MTLLDRRLRGFKQTLRQFLRSKTNWSALTLIVTGLAAYLGGEISLAAMLGAVFNGLSLLFVRDAIAGREAAP